jgi:hypothetical protein
MRFESFVRVAVAACAVASASPAAAADVALSDPLCPRAVPQIAAFNEAASSKDVVKITSAVRGVADAYVVCVSEAQVKKGVAVEPTVNYDKTRAAQYLVVLGRALAASGNTADAVTALKNARQFADDVVGWQPASQTWHASNVAGNSASRNVDANGSRYKDAAKEIRTAADDELAKLGAPAPSAPPKPN